MIPVPTSFLPHDGVFMLNEHTSLAADNLSRLGGMLRDYLSPATGFPLPLGRQDRNAIHLGLDKRLGAEAYELKVTPEKVDIKAGSEAGVFYGMQTLRQLLPVGIFRKAPMGDPDQWRIPCCEITDSPRFGWRGSMIDVARHFMPKEFLLKFIDLLALHKMNVFHIHLVDDQGWRIEIKKYPRLTEVGSWRKETMVGPFSDAKFDGLPHGGFYTQDDIREIVRYAADRFVTVVPEIEMPGHAQSAIAGYPELGGRKKGLEVSTRWGVHDDVYNVEDSTLSFLRDVLTEVMALFPSKFIHIGGDEVRKGQWKADERAQARMKANGLKNEDELQSWFIQQMNAFLEGKGRRLIGWDEILEGGLAPGASVMSWRGEEGGIAAAKAGHDVVMAPSQYTYLDFYQSRLTRREPLAIGGYLPLAKVYAYDPSPAELTADEARHVLGAQCQLWTEYIQNPKQVEYMAFPRLCAMAEAVWTPRKDFRDFIARLDEHKKRLAILDVVYRAKNDAPVATWRSGETSEQFQTTEWDVTAVMDGAGRYTALFAYTGGAHRLDIAWVELVVDGAVAWRDEHAATTGARDKDNEYHLTLDKPGTRYLLRASVRSDAGADSNGEIHLVRDQ